MAVIAHLRIPAESFELGRIFDLNPGATIELETMVPLGEKAVPFFSVSEEVRDSFEQSVQDHPSVENIVEVSRHDNEQLYSLDWNVARDVFFQGIVELNGQLLSATGTATDWEFELRFPTHEALDEFQEYCRNAHIRLEVGRIYNPVRPGSGAWYGLTTPQREALVRAVEGGYYSIPREMSTQDLADALGISDQAVTERLRRAIITLVENTLIAMEAEEAEEFTSVDADTFDSE
jgi:hypothetical protein